MPGAVAYMGLRRTPCRGWKPEYLKTGCIHVPTACGASSRTQDAIVVGRVCLQKKGEVSAVDAQVRGWVRGWDQAEGADGREGVTK